jgi:hypothetical protein
MLIISFRIFYSISGSERGLFMYTLYLLSRINNNYVDSGRGLKGRTPRIIIHSSNTSSRASSEKFALWGMALSCLRCFFFYFLLIFRRMVQEIIESNCRNVLLL